MAYVIVNKKKFCIFLVAVFLVVGTCVFLVVYFLNKKDISKNIESAEKIIDEETVDSSNEKKESSSVTKDNKVEEVKILTEYENQRFSYRIKFSDKWYMNNDSSEDDLREIELDEGVKLMAGGQTFWSNYSDINKYSPSDKPSDFRLINLTVYQKNNSNIEDLAVILDFGEDAEKLDFFAGEVKGAQYIVMGLSEGNPRVAVIFQKDSLFYVFRMAFIGGDENVAREIEEIISSIKFN